MNHAEYNAYIATVEAFYEMHQIDNLIGDGASYYSNYPCECCQRPYAGMREDADGVYAGIGVIDTYSVCEDCLYFAAYGKLSDAIMLELDN